MQNGPLGACMLIRGMSNREAALCYTLEGSLRNGNCQSAVYGIKYCIYLNIG